MDYTDRVKCFLDDLRQVLGKHGAQITDAVLTLHFDGEREPDLTATFVNLSAFAAVARCQDVNGTEIICDEPLHWRVDDVA